MVWTGRKFKAQERLELAESQLRRKAIMGMAEIWREGVGATPQPRYNRAQAKEKRDLVLEEVRAVVVDVRTSRMVSLRQQTVYDRLPSPDNLHVWGKSDLPSSLCPGGTLEHIIISCPAALGGGCYCWRHDQVLKVVAETISSAVANNKHASSQKSFPFMKAGEKPRPKPTPKPSASLLSSA